MPDVFRKRVISMAGCALRYGWGSMMQDLIDRSQGRIREIEVVRFWPAEQLPPPPEGSKAVDIDAPPSGVMPSNNDEQASESDGKRLMDW